MSEYDGLLKESEGWGRPSFEASDDAHRKHWLLGKLSAAIRAQSKRIAELESQYAMTKANRDEVGEECTRLILRAEAAESRLAEIERANKEHHRNMHRLWDIAQGYDPDDQEEGPRCRDCADENGTCPGSGFPCDPQKAAEARIKSMRARLAEIDRYRGEAEKVAAQLNVKSDKIQNGWTLALNSDVVSALLSARMEGEAAGASELKSTREALDIAREYLNQREDIRTSGAPNDAMKCLAEINEAMEKR